MDSALNNNQDQAEARAADPLNHMVHLAKVRKIIIYLLKLHFWIEWLILIVKILGGFGSQQQQQPGSGGSFGSRPSQSYGTPSQGIPLLLNIFYWNDFWAKNHCEQVHLLVQATFHLHRETFFLVREINTMPHNKAAAVLVAHLHRPTVHLRLASALPQLVLALPHQLTGLRLNPNLEATLQATKAVLIKEMEDHRREVLMDTHQEDQVKETKVDFESFILKWKVDFPSQIWKLFENTKYLPKRRCNIYECFGIQFSYQLINVRNQIIGSPSQSYGAPPRQTFSPPATSYGIPSGPSSAPSNQYAPSSSSQQSGFPSTGFGKYFFWHLHMTCT